MNEEWNRNVEDDDYAYQTVMRNGKPKTMGWSVASLVLGILSVVCCCFGYAGIIFGVAAIAVAVISRRSLGYFDGMCIAGLLLGIFGTVFGVSMFVIISSIPEEEWDKMFEDFMKEYEQTNPGEF